MLPPFATTSAFRTVESPQTARLRRVSEAGFSPNDATARAPGKSRPAGALLPRSYREWRPDRLCGRARRGQRTEIRGQKTGEEGREDIGQGQGQGQGQGH